jgi:hypothetical protein
MNQAADVHVADIMGQMDEGISNADLIPWRAGAAPKLARPPWRRTRTR